jgi:LacI family transcriptional regulator
MKLDDIARKSGVSRATVSRVINNKGYVSEQVRERVLTVIEQENFTPNPAARMLASQRTRVITIAIPHMTDVSGYFSTIVHGISQTIQERDYSMLLWLGIPGDKDGAFYKRIIRNRLLDGIILALVHKNDALLPLLVESNIPFVMVDRPNEFQDRISYVCIDSVEGARCAVRHLIEQGYRRIATITGDLRHTEGDERLLGYRLALEDAGIPFDPSLVAEGDFNFASAYQGMKALLPCNVDAVFAGSDMMAIGALQAIYEAGLRVPDDIAVVGFDDLPTAVSTTPQLTTIHQPIHEKGARAAAILIDLIEEKVKAPQQVLLPTHLVVRQSSIKEVTME